MKKQESYLEELHLQKNKEINQIAKMEENHLGEVISKVKTLNK